MILPSAADAPRSPHDTFVLSAARARAAVIVTSGANVRAEPRLTHELIGEGAEGLRAWRGGGQQSRPDTVVLSRDPALNLSHPLFSAGKPAHVLTTAPAALAIRYAALPLTVPPRSLHAAHCVALLGARRMCETEGYRAHVVEVKGRAARVPTGVIPYAQALAVAGGGGWPTAEGGFRSDVVLECGISAAVPFYGMGGARAAPAAAGAARQGVVDELLLSVFRGGLPTEATGADFLPWSFLQEYFGAEELARAVDAQHTVAAEREGESWSFLRLCRGPS